MGSPIKRLSVKGKKVPQAGKVKIQDRPPKEPEVRISLGAATAFTAEELALALKVSDASMYQKKFSRNGAAQE